MKLVSYQSLAHQKTWVLALNEIHPRDGLQFLEIKDLRYVCYFFKTGDR